MFANGVHGLSVVVETYLHHWRPVDACPVLDAATGPDEHECTGACQRGEQLVNNARRMPGHGFVESVRNAPVAMARDSRAETCATPVLRVGRGAAGALGNDDR